MRCYNNMKLNCIRKDGGKIETFERRHSVTMINNSWAEQSSYESYSLKK